MRPTSGDSLENEGPTQPTRRARHAMKIEMKIWGGQEVKPRNGLSPRYTKMWLKTVELIASKPLYSKKIQFFSNLFGYRI
jgi:hypothetical protein